MKLSELLPANDLLGDDRALAARFDQEGCLLVRGAFHPPTLADVVDQATSALERYGLAQRRDGIRWTGAVVPHLDKTGINDIPVLKDLLNQIEDGSDFFRPVADRICGHPMHIWRALHIFAAVPDDPSHVTPPHQDNFEVTATGDYRRLWIALTEIPFGDGGLGLALGSHRHGQLPHQQLPEFTDRAAPGQENPLPPANGINPLLVGDRWYTASMQPGDLITFHPKVVHRGLRATSDRIRLALTVIASAISDPLPHTMYTDSDNRARRDRVRELAASLGLSEVEQFAVAADLARIGMPIDEHTVRAAARGDYAHR